MSSRLRECSQTVRRLHQAALRLELECEFLQIGPLAGREWFDLLRQKLLPQLHDDAFLVVAVVGGTNIGKSVIFNHIAGSCLSATSPLASGTKHPVCLVPNGFGKQHDLAAIFDGFFLKPWKRVDESLQEHDEHQLYWKTSSEIPENLLILDTPDIDSDAEVNWRRADIVRRSADVLFAVLTQQKYNDAAVKQFFRKAAAEDKAVIVLFNQCQLPEDDEYWPLWLETFCRETGVAPEIVYIAPGDREAAETNRLPFYERPWPQFAEAVAERTEDSGRHSLAEDLSRLRFVEIKLRSLRGSLKLLLDQESGAPSYLREVNRRSGEFAKAAERLSSESVVRVHDWPMLPSKLFVQEIRQWWTGQQEGWSRRVHRFYDAVGHGVLWPVRFARDRMQPDRVSPMEEYRQAEWGVVLKTVEEVFEKLSWMSESGNALLKPHFERVLAGKSREELIARLRHEHETAPLDAELERNVSTVMRQFQSDSPEMYRFYRQLHNVSAAVRPATSVVLFTLGWGPAGELVAPLMANAAAHTVVPIVADLAGGTAAAVAGESALTGAAGQGAGLLQAKFQQLQSAFTAHRVEWLVQVLKRELLGSLPDDFCTAAGIRQSEAYREVTNVVENLKQQLHQMDE